MDRIARLPLNRAEASTEPPDPSQPRLLGSEIRGLRKARAITLNAKMRRTGICGAAETLLIDRPVLKSHLPAILDDLIAAGCEIRGDAEVQASEARSIAATEADWS